MPASKATFTLETARGQLPKPSHVAGRILHQRMAGLSGMTKSTRGWVGWGEKGLAPPSRPPLPPLPVRNPNPQSLKMSASGTHQGLRDTNLQASVHTLRILFLLSVYTSHTT